MPEMLSTYYEKRGWTPEGVPSDDRLRDLGLEWTKAKM